MPSQREKISRFHLDRKVTFYLATAATLLLYLVSCSPEELSTNYFSTTPNPSNTPHPSATYNPDYQTTPNHPDIFATSTAFKQENAVVSTRDQFTKNEATAIQKTAVYIRTPDNFQSEIAKQPLEAVANAIYFRFGNPEIGRYSSGSGGVIETSEILGHPEMQIIHIPTNLHVADEFRSGEFTEFSLQQPHIPGGFNLGQLNSTNTIVITSAVEKSDFAHLSVVVPSGVKFENVNWETNSAPTPAGTSYSSFGFTSIVENQQIVPIPLPFQILTSLPPIPHMDSFLVFVISPVHTVVHGQSGSVIFKKNPDNSSSTAIGLTTSISYFCDEISTDSTCNFAVGVTTFPKDLQAMIDSANQYFQTQLP